MATARPLARAAERVKFTSEVWTRVVALGLVLAGCGNGICSSSELTDALAMAEPGDVVTVGSCEVEGAFVVPAGVTIRGAGISSVLGSVEGGAVLDVAG